MISTVITLIVLVGLFLLGIKWSFDLIREWPRKKPMSRYYEQQRSVRKSSNTRLRDENHLTRPVTQVTDTSVQSS